MKSGAGDDPFSDPVDEAEDERAADVDAPESAEAQAGEADAVTEANAAADANAELDADVNAETARDASAADGPVPSDVVAADDEIPWVLRRRSVKDDRPNVTQFFLRDETDRAERRFRGAVEERLDTDVYLLDLREAAYVVAMQHPDEVASLLGRWGYDHRD